MAEDWSREEVEATVADYFDMLDLELRGQDYNKSAHRRGLASLLNGRTDGAIERKHQNISAILIELGFVYIAGYKPLQNYQQLLFETVSDLLARSRLAGKVERVSETRGDGLGYDVLSFEVSGRERLIEVKTTAYGASTPFFVTRNEVAVSRDASDQFHLYRAFNFRRQPRLFFKQGPLEKSFTLEPSQFVATIT